MKLLTGNDLKTGEVIWWTGDGWSVLVENAADVGSEGDTLAQIEEAALRVNMGYVIDATAGGNGKPVPAHIKDRIRAAGPTVRPDLQITPADPASGNWVI